MQERALGPGIRIIAGLFGVVVLVAALLIAATQVRAGWGSDLRAWLAAAAVLIVAIAAVRVVRAAIRGTIRVRGGRTGRRSGT